MKQLLLAILLCLSSALSQAEERPSTLPAPAELNATLGSFVVKIKVVEPHLQNNGQANTVVYVGYPAEKVLANLFGADWNASPATIAFYAIDGYISHIPSAQFDHANAYLVFKRADGLPFSVHNHDQRETVGLGPYYLVWDNINARELLQDGVTNWPYQVNRIGLSHQDASLPGADDPKWAPTVALTSKQCLTCHSINGYGGAKYPVDLVQAGTVMTEDAFIHWLLSPVDVLPGATMPALMPEADQVRRSDVAQQIYAYLKHIAGE